MNQKLINEWIRQARNGKKLMQKRLEVLEVDWDNGEVIDANAKTATQIDFASPKQFAQPKVREINGWQKFNNAMPIKATEILPDYLFEGK